MFAENCSFAAEIVDVSKISETYFFDYERELLIRKRNYKSKYRDIYVVRYTDDKINDAGSRNQRAQS